MKFEDVYTSDSEVEGINEAPLVKERSKLKVEDLSRTSAESDAEQEDMQVNTNFNWDNLKLGVFVVVRLKSVSTKKETFRKFVGVIQDDPDNDGDIKVMFMRPNLNDLSRFFPNEKDISYVTFEEIVCVLLQPEVEKRGSRIYHQFKKPVVL